MKKDLDGMLEWMKDEKINQYFRFAAEDTTKDKAKEFIENSFVSDSRHYAIVNADDVYLGTVSLKNINYKDQNAEYAISLRECARGKDIARQATIDILHIAFDELKLQKIYLNVFSNNGRAIRFYEKMNFKYVGEFRKHVKIGDSFCDLKWFEVQREDLDSAEKL